MIQHHSQNRTEHAHPQQVPPESAALPTETRWREPNNRWPVVAVLNRQNRGGVDVAGTGFYVRSNALVDVLAGVPDDVELLYLVGPAPGKYRDVRAWARGPMPQGWVRGSHYYGGEPIFKFRRPDGRRLKMLAGSTWGFTGADPADFIAVLRWLDDALSRSDVFRGARLMDTPLATGRMLWQGSIDFDKRTNKPRTWPILPAELQQLVTGTSAQGRVEWFGGESRNVAHGLLELDGRLMYAACARELGIGPGTHSPPRDHSIASQRDFQRVKDDLSFMPGRYRVRFMVPAGWAHIGLLGHFAENVRTYPSEPGFVGEGWSDGAELLLAADNDWTFDVIECITFERADGTKGPLDRWVTALLTLEENAGPQAGRAVRLMIVKTIGGFAMRSREVERSAPAELHGEVPAKYHPRLIDGEWRWSEPAAVALPDLAHPEWSSQVWGRCRARMAGFALGVPREQLLGIGLDALWLDAMPSETEPGPALEPKPEKVAVGRLRQKAFVSGPLPPLSSIDQLRAIRNVRRG